MFEQLSERMRLRAEQRARSRCVQLCERLSTEMPRGVEVELVHGGVRLSARGLVRRHLLEPALRWLTAGAWR